MGTTYEMSLGTIEIIELYYLNNNENVILMDMNMENVWTLLW